MSIFKNYDENAYDYFMQTTTNERIHAVGVQKINANGIKYILEIINENMDEQNRNQFLEIIESKLENVSENEIQDLESF